MYLHALSASEGMKVSDYASASRAVRMRCDKLVTSGAESAMSDRLGRSSIPITGETVEKRPMPHSSLPCGEAVALHVPAWGHHASSSVGSS